MQSSGVTLSTIQCGVQDADVEKAANGCRVSDCQVACLGLPGVPLSVHGDTQVIEPYGSWLRRWQSMNISRESQPGGDAASGCDRASAKDFHEIRAVFTRRVA